MEDLYAFSANNVKGAAAEEREKYFSAEGQCESMFRTNSFQQAFWKLRLGGAHYGGRAEKEGGLEELGNQKLSPDAPSGSR